MKRPQSDKTKLRHARAELQELRERLTQHVSLGRQMANVLYNLQWVSRLTDRERKTMEEVVREWDDLRGRSI